MPHQCLSCGESFADGSTDLLKGCPSCEGTRFFYTDEPLGDEARAELKEDTQKSAHDMLQELLEKGEKRDLNSDIWSREAWEQWIRVGKDKDGGIELEQLTQDDVVLPKDREPLETGTSEEDGGLTVEEPEETLQVKLEDVQEVEELAPPEPEADEEATDHEFTVQDPETGRPSTLNISEPGNYEIDVERLMDGNPVIVERDGSYVIHLPSVFGDKKKA